MASTQQKKTSGKSAASRTKKTAAAETAHTRPIRREVWGVALLLLSMCVTISYFGVPAILLDWLAVLLKGLFGYGYWLTAPTLLLSALILLFHHGRPVQLRVTCALLLPALLGSLGHMLLCRETFVSSLGILRRLWETGQIMASGGAISGAVAVGSVAVFSKLVSVIIFTALFAVLAMIALRVTVNAVLEKRRERPQYEPEPEPRIRVVETEAPRRRVREKRQIDFPLDDETPSAPAGRKAGKEQEESAEEEERQGFTGFFRHKSDHQRTPDQVLSEKEKERRTAPRPEPPEPEEAAPPPEESEEAPPAPEAVETPPERRESPKSEAAPAPAPRGSKSERLASEVAAQSDEVAAAIARTLTGEEADYRFPPVSLLRENQGENYIEAGAELRNNSRRLAETLISFGVDATAGDVIHGPSVTRYEFVLEQGVKLSKITNLADDIALALGATGVRIAPIPNKSSVVGIEVPNQQVTPVLIRDVIASPEFTGHKSTTAFAVGKDISGRCVVGSIEKLPHVLIAGTTGSGKSVCTNSLIISLLYKSTPSDVRFIMVDPKMVELAPYTGIPHLLIPVVTDPKKAAGALQWAVREMMNRYKTFSENGVKKLEEYNQLSQTREELKHMPSIVVVIDELADLMMVAAKEVEESIMRVAQMGRAAGMHLVIATQRPSADVITGLMKANIPSRIAFAVASSIESRIILDTTGAEKLVGKGDMLYAPLGEGKLRVQGCFISPEEIEQVVAFVKSTGETHYDDQVIAAIDDAAREKDGKASAQAAAEPVDESDELLPAAVEVVLETGQASVSMLQRRLKLGYSRAARLVDQMEQKGYVGPFEGSKPRQLLITKEKWQEMRLGPSQSPEEDEDL